MIYMDNGATTAMDSEVAYSMFPFFVKYYGNPSGLYDLCNVSRNAVIKARKDIAALINADDNEIFFTSGGTEGDNWIIKNAALKPGAHIIASAIEHHAILESCEFIRRRGTEVDYIGVDGDGIVNLNELQNKIKPNTSLVSIMLVNNEIGTIQNIKKISDIVKKRGVKLHTDAVAAFGKIPIDVKALGVDYLTASGHKFHGPKGVGFIYAKNSEIESFMHGGQQEKNKRAGTENVASIVGMAKAAVLSVSRMEYSNKRKKEMDLYITGRILNEIPYSKINGNAQRVWGTMNFCFKNVDGATLSYMLSKQGICVSTGSACMSFSKEPSHVLKAIGLTDDLLYSSIRLTIGDDLTLKEAAYVVDCIKENVMKLRRLTE